MSGELFRRTGVGIGILYLLGVFYVTPASAQELGASPQRALLDRYCVTCHNERLRTADLTLDTVDVANLEEHAETWEKVARKLRAGAMPPTPRPRPDEETYNAFANWIESGLDSIAAREPNPGRTEAFPSAPNHGCTGSCRCFGAKNKGKWCVCWIIQWTFHWMASLCSPRRRCSRQ